jgi:hypothetical protein
MGDKEFDAAQQRGRAVSFDAAVSYALSLKPWISDFVASRGCFLHGWCGSGWCGHG